MTLNNKLTLHIRFEEDIIVARQKVREFAQAIGFQNMDIILIATAVSEITRNIIIYATKGEIEISRIVLDHKKGIQIIASDNGPGIDNLALAMEDGYSTGNGLGLGLPGAKRLMDEFEITTEINKGTKIKMQKWMQ
jgi:serine/threonine-protein kinase RsbT